MPIHSLNLSIEAVKEYQKVIKSIWVTAYKKADKN
jgi:hypothetical protein